MNLFMNAFQKYRVFKSRNTFLGSWERENFNLSTAEKIAIVCTRLCGLTYEQVHED